MDSTTFKLKQQLKALTKERNEFREKAKRFKAKLRGPALQGQSRKLQAEISTLRAELEARDAALATEQAARQKLEGELKLVQAEKFDCLKTLGELRQH